MNISKIGQKTPPYLSGQKKVIKTSQDLFKVNLGSLDRLNDTLKRPNDVSVKGSEKRLPMKSSISKGASGYNSKNISRQNSNIEGESKVSANDKSGDGSIEICNKIRPRAKTDAVIMNKRKVENRIVDISPKVFERITEEPYGYKSTATFNPPPGSASIMLKEHDMMDPGQEDESYNKYIKIDEPYTPLLCTDVPKSLTPPSLQPFVR